MVDFGTLISPQFVPNVIDNTSYLNNYAGTMEFIGERNREMSQLNSKVRQELAKIKINPNDEYIREELNRQFDVIMNENSTLLGSGIAYNAFMEHYGNIFDNKQFRAAVENNASDEIFKDKVEKEPMDTYIKQYLLDTKSYKGLAEELQSGRVKEILNPVTKELSSYTKFDPGFIIKDMDALTYMESLLKIMNDNQYVDGKQFAADANGGKVSLEHILNGGKFYVKDEKNSNKRRFASEGDILENRRTEANISDLLDETDGWRLGNEQDIMSLLMNGLNSVQGANDAFDQQYRAALHAHDNYNDDKYGAYLNINGKNTKLTYRQFLLNKFAPLAKANAFDIISEDIDENYNQYIEARRKTGTGTNKTDIGQSTELDKLSQTVNINEYVSGVHNQSKDTIINNLTSRNMNTGETRGKYRKSTDILEFNTASGDIFKFNFNTDFTKDKIESFIKVILDSDLAPDEKALTIRGIYEYNQSRTEKEYRLNNLQDEEAYLRQKLIEDLNNGTLKTSFDKIDPREDYTNKPGTIPAYQRILMSVRDFVTKFNVNKQVDNIEGNVTQYQKLSQLNIPVSIEKLNNIDESEINNITFDLLNVSRTNNGFAVSFGNNTGIELNEENVIKILSKDLCKLYSVFKNNDITITDNKNPLYTFYKEYDNLISKSKENNNESGSKQIVTQPLLYDVDKAEEFYRTIGLSGEIKSEYSERIKDNEKLSQAIIDNINSYNIYKLGDKDKGVYSKVESNKDKESIKTAFNLSKDDVNKSNINFMYAIDPVLGPCLYAKDGKGGIYLIQGGIDNDLNEIYRKSNTCQALKRVTYAASYPNESVICLNSCRNNNKTASKGDMLLIPRLSDDGLTVTFDLKLGNTIYGTGITQNQAVLLTEHSLNIFDTYCNLIRNSGGRDKYIEALTKFAEECKIVTNNSGAITEILNNFPLNTK